MQSELALLRHVRFQRANSVLAVSTDKKRYSASQRKSLHDRKQHSIGSPTDREKTSIDKHFSHYSTENVSYLFNDNYIQANWETLIANGNHRNHQIYKRTMNSVNSSSAMATALPALLHKKLSHLETEEDLPEYPPHRYAEEGDSDNLSELDSIDFPDEDSFDNALKDLGPKFKILASICKPPHTQNIT